MRIRTKLALLLFFSVAVFVIVMTLFTHAEGRRLRSLFGAEEFERRLTFYRVLKLTGSSLEGFAFDYTYWDEMAGFVGTGDRVWAETNIDPSLKTFNAVGAWVYAATEKQIYSVSASDDRDLERLPLPQGALTKLFDTSRFCHFFLYTSKGLVEVRGATIHPSLDIDRVTEPQGYFLVGRLWDREYVAGLETMLDADLSIAPATLRDHVAGVSDAVSGTLVFSKTLKGWEAKPVAILSVRMEATGIRLFREGSDQTLLLIISCLAVFFVILWVFLSYWIVAPLRMLSDSFVRREPIADKKLLAAKDEIGYMVTLMNKFFEQRKHLIAEMAEHRMALRALRISEEKFAKAFHSNPSIVAIFSRADGHFLEVNDTFTKATGYSRDEVVRHTVGETSLISAESAGVIVSILKKQASIQDMEVAYTTKSGEARAFLFSAEKIDVGTKQTLLVVGSDITERKLAEKNLEDAQRQLVQSEKMAALGRFASGVAHEVKNPLAIVLGGLEYLKLKLTMSADPEVHEAMTKMRESVLRADIIVKDLLAFARPSRAVFEKTDPAVLLRDAISFIELFRHRSDTSNIEIRQELIGHEMCIEVDRNQMQQALFNIMMNAIEAIGMDGGLVLKAYSSDAVLPFFGDQERQVCVLEVRDTGSGISGTDLPKIFEPFFTTKRERKGTGLGLAITRSIVEKHKGVVTIESEPGKGTIVKILLPLAQKGAKEAIRT